MQHDSRLFFFAEKPGEERAESNDSADERLQAQALCFPVPMLLASVVQPLHVQQSKHGMDGGGVHIHQTSDFVPGDKGSQVKRDATAGLGANSRVIRKRVQARGFCSLQLEADRHGKRNRCVSTHIPEL